LSLSEIEPERTRIELFDCVWWIYFRRLEPVRRRGQPRRRRADGLRSSSSTRLVTSQTYQRADAFLFGRRTYELFAGYWGAEERARAAAEDPGNHPITDALNTKPKYVASKPGGT
jgi:hypothetical protein